MLPIRFLGGAVIMSHLPSLNTNYTVPCKESGSGEIVVDLGNSEIETLKGASEDHFLADKCQWKIDAAQCHPVDFAFPPSPVPPHHRVRNRASIDIMAEPTN